MTTNYGPFFSSGYVHPEQDRTFRYCLTSHGRSISGEAYTLKGCTLADIVSGVACACVARDCDAFEIWATA